MKAIITSILFTVLCYASTFAQQVDIFSLTYTYNSGVGLMNPPGPALEALDLDVTEVKANFFLPTQLGNGTTTIFNGVEWKFISTFFDQLPDALFIFGRFAFFPVHSRYQPAI